MKIISWNITIELEDGSVTTVSDMPDFVAEVIDEFLTELEQGI